MKKIIVLLLLAAPLASAITPMPTEAELEQSLPQVMAVAQRVNANAMSFQVLKRCGASPELLKKTKLYLYKDIATTQRENPLAKVDVDGLFESAVEGGNQHYESMKANPKYCAGMLAQAAEYSAN